MMDNKVVRENLGCSNFIYRGKSYSVNLDSESSRLKFKNCLEEETGKEWGIADLERYVFYRKDMYNLVSSFLVLNDTFRGKVEIPINAVSCTGMFCDKSLEGIDFSDFDTSGIKDMSRMFYKCTFPEGFSLGDKFDTSSVEDMRFMFRDCIFPEGFSLGDKFDTSRVENMELMFYECTFPEGFSLGDNFDTSNVRNMDSMLCKCTFPMGFRLGDKFDTSKVLHITGMFFSTQFNEDFILSKNFTIPNEHYHLFFMSKLPSRVAKQLNSKTTDVDIIELLKSDSTAVKSLEDNPSKAGVEKDTESLTTEVKSFNAFSR